MNFKVCRICLSNFPESGFSKNSRNSDKLDNCCKKCKAISYSINSEKNKKKARDNYWKNVSARRKQKSEKYEKYKDSILKSRRESWLKNPELKKNRDKYWSERRRLCFIKLGSCCSKCGCTDDTILCIDHILNDGNEERKSGISNLKIWNKIISAKDLKYQLLCFNCNLKKSLYNSSFQNIGILKFCPSCMNNLDLSCFKKDMKYEDDMYYECRSCTSVRGQILKRLAFLKLGSSSCLVCGEDDLDVLTADHINDNGGGKYRIDKGISIYRKILRDEIKNSRFQVLCLNCNIKKYLGLVIAPVQTKSEPIIVHDFQFHDTVINRVKGSDSTVVKFLAKYHYSGYGRAGISAYTVIYDECLVAVMKVTNPIRVEVATSIGLSPSNVLELDRFCIHPDFHKKNFASFLLSKLVKSVRFHFPEHEAIVSFADPGHGHSGTIYSAANFKFVGNTSRGYEYVSEYGSIIHKKTVYNAAKCRGLKEKEYADITNLVKRNTVKKLKFIYYLHDS